MMKIIAWPFGPLGIVAVAFMLFAVPTQLEGPVLAPISPGHALTKLDILALMPLLTGTAWLYYGIWQRREQLFRSVHQSPGESGAALFVAGFGLGLLIASVFSAFFWWWILGAALFGATIMATLVAVTRK